MSPRHGILEVADPPLTDGRYHREGERATWYGSSSEASAWAELVKNPPNGVDPRETRRRLGRVSFDVVALDLTNDKVQKSLGVTVDDLTSKDRTSCQMLADLAREAGFEAIVAPSAAKSNETTLAVFAPAFEQRSRDIVDLGVSRPR